MTCTVPKKERTVYAQLLVLEYFQSMPEAQSMVVTPDTSLGKWGLGHTMVKRKTYHGGISDRLALKGCRMGKLKPNDFTDAAKYKFVGDISNAVEKDLV